MDQLWQTLIGAKIMHKDYGVLELVGVTQSLKVRRPRHANVFRTTPDMISEIIEEPLVTDREKVFLHYLEQESGITIAEAKDNKKNRKTKFVEFRFLHMIFLHKVMYYSLERAGATYGKDHSTVLYALKTVKDLLETNKDFRAKYANTINVIHNLRKDALK